MPERGGKIIDSGVEFDLVVLKLNDRGAAQNFEQHGNTFTGDTLNQALHATECRVLEANILTRLEIAELLQRGVIAVLFEVADALNEFVVQGGGFETEAHDGGNAFGAAHGGDALIGLTGPEEDVAREHGLEQRHRTLLGFFELFIQRQIRIKGLLLQIELCDLLLQRLGVCEVPTV